MKCNIRLHFLKTVQHIKDEHFVSVTKPPEKSKISAGLNGIIFREKRFFSVTRSTCDEITGNGTKSLVVLQDCFACLLLILH